MYQNNGATEHTYQCLLDLDYKICVGTDSCVKTIPKVNINLFTKNPAVDTQIHIYYK